MITGTCAFWRRITPRKAQPVHGGQLEIGQHQVGAVDHLEALFGGGGLVHVEPAGEELQLDHAAQFFFVFNHQNAFLHAAGARSGAVHRQNHAENAALSRFALHRYLTAVLVDDFGNDGQPEANPLRLGSEERIENIVALRGIDAAPRSITATSHSRSAGAGLHRDGSARRAGLRGVEQQIVKNTFQQFGIESETAECRARNCVDSDAGRLAFRQRHGTIQRLDQVGRCELRLERARELQEAGDQRIAAVHFGGDEAGHLARHFVFRRQAARQHFRRSTNGAERIAQFMGEAGGKLAERSQAVGAAFLFLRLQELKVGRGELLGCGAGFAGLAPQVLGQDVGKIADHGEENGAPDELRGVDVPVGQVDEGEKGKIGGRGQQGDGQGSRIPKAVAAVTMGSNSTSQ